ncbi:MAG: zinc ribbon-containing protein [Desulfuromusa sp.]|nr:zinc ribbon-containing protein [Desulfuromusa sp.]
MTESHQKKNEQEDVSLYEKIISRTEELLVSSRKNLDEALKKAGDELSSAGNFTREQAEKVSAFVKRDIQHTFASAGKGKDSVKQAVDPKRVAAGAQSIFSRILSNAAETLTDWAKKTEQQLEYKTGEITSPGTLTCKECGEEIQMKKTAKIPPCPKCHHTIYRKSY